MNLFSPILRLFGLGGLRNADTGPQVGATSSIDTNTGISVTDERALQVSSVWACVQLIANAIASLPLDFYRSTGDDEREKITDHALVDLFKGRPNPNMKPRDFRKAMTSQLVIWSNAYAEIFYSGERPVALMPLKPARMVPFIDDNGALTYHYSMSDGVRILSPRSVMHLKGFGTEGIVGLERNNFARQSLGLSVSADTYAASQFRNGGRSDGGRITFDEFLDDKQRAAVRKLYEGLTETAYNKNKLWILEGGAKYESDGLNPDTMQMIETRKWQVGEICRFYGVPEVLVGGGEKNAAWPASFEQQLLSFLTFTLQDYIDEWEHTINYSLLTPAERRSGIFADHDVTGFIKMDSVARATLDSTWVQNGLKTRNEIRKRNNDPPKEGADELTVQVNLTDLSQLPQVTNNAQTP